MLTDNLIKVQLQIFWEQGMEGIEWSAHDYTKEGYEGLICLTKGDYLEIPNIWKGIIIPDTISYKNFPDQIKKQVENKEYRDILNSYGFMTKSLSDEECKDFVYSNYRKQIVEGYTCFWIQKDVDPKVWVSCFADELEAYYCSKESCQ